MKFFHPQIQLARESMFTTKLKAGEKNIKLIFTCALPFIGSGVLSAQASSSFQEGKKGMLDLPSSVGLLEQNNFLALIGAGALVLMGAACICAILKTCKLLQNTRISILILVAGLSAFCSSCTTMQQAMVAQSDTTKATVYYCNCPVLYRQASYPNTYFNNRYPSNSYSNWRGPVFCKHCGLRIIGSQQ